jgi:hypothetical protein
VGNSADARRFVFSMLSVKLMKHIDSKLVYFGAGLVIAAIVIPVSVYVMWPEPIPEPTTTPVLQKPEQTRMGPGVLTASNSAAAQPADSVSQDYSWVPPGLEVTPDQRLVLNKDMRMVFDYFLQPADRGNRADRLKKLQTYLKAKLPPTAYDEATQLASNYARYLEALDARNATQPDPMQSGEIPTTYAGIEQLKANLAEQTRLRQTILGVNISQLWFADEDADVQRFLERRGQTPKFPVPGSGS